MKTLPLKQKKIIELRKQLFDSIKSSERKDEVNKMYIKVFQTDKSKREKELSNLQRRLKDLEEKNVESHSKIIDRKFFITKVTFVASKQEFLLNVASTTFCVKSTHLHIEFILVIR